MDTCKIKRRKIQDEAQTAINRSHRLGIMRIFYFGKVSFMFYTNLNRSYRKYIEKMVCAMIVVQETNKVYAKKSQLLNEY